MGLLDGLANRCLHRRHGQTFVGHQLLNELGGFGKRFGLAAARDAGPPRHVERRPAVGVLRLEVGAVLDEERDERVEAVLRSAMERGLVWCGGRTRHLTAAYPALGRDDVLILRRGRTVDGAAASIG